MPDKTQLVMNQASDSGTFKPDDIKQALSSVSGPSAPSVEEEILIEIETDSRKHGDDYRVLSKFIGMSVLVIGILSVVPTIYFVASWASSDEVTPIPRWTYLITFLAALHILYAVYIYMIADYSALGALAAFLLIVTCFYGFIVAAILLDDGSGRVVQFLQLPATLTSRAAIWSGFMFSISALCCFLFGRESIIWRKRQAIDRTAGS